MKRLLSTLVGTIVVLSIGLTVFPDNADTELKAVCRLANWNGSTYVTTGSGVAISPYWVLTVAHTGGAYIEQDNVVYPVLQSISHSGPNNVNADLRLYRVAGPLKYAVPMSFRPFSGQNGLDGLPAKLVGFGKTGTRTSWGWSITGGEGARRQASNAIDILIPAVQVQVGQSTWTSDCLFFDLDDPLGIDQTNVAGGTAIAGEGGIATYDSGSGMFVFENGLNRLVSINAYVGTIDGSGVPDWNYFGGVGGGPYLNPYRDWILATVPDIGRCILNSMSLEFGSTVLSGSLLDVESSNDVRLNLRSPNLALSDLQFQVGVIFNGTTTAVPATSMDLTIEDRVNVAAATGLVHLKNWTSGQFEAVGSFVTGPSDVTKTFTNIPAANYVDASGRVQFRIRYLTSAAEILYLQPSLDTVRIDVR